MQALAASLLSTVGVAVPAGAEAPVTVLAALGLVYVARSFVAPVVSGVWGYFLQPRGPKVKGGLKGRWAVVTGSTDGIGKAVALELSSKHKMNIVLVSRSGQKLHATAKEIADGAAGVETRTIELDFNTAADENFAQHVTRVTDDLDVALLVNNAGCSYEHAERFELLDPSRVSMLINLNVLALTKLTHAILPKMLENKSGAIVNVSSASSLVSEPYYAVYSATKAFVNNFSRALHAECAGRGVTVHAAIPFFVTTKLSKLRSTSFTVVNEKTYAQALIRDVGMEPLRVNTWNHAIQAFVIGVLPEFLVKKFLVSNALSIRKRAYAKKAAASKTE
jgi:17beta-estradiol 17-dehydrogenase / very-long-chain 3-oxoacyl-CoA reductase